MKKRVVIVALVLTIIMTTSAIALEFSWGVYKEGGNAYSRVHNTSYIGGVGLIEAFDETFSAGNDDVVREFRVKGKSDDRYGCRGRVTQFVLFENEEVYRRSYSIIDVDGYNVFDGEYQPFTTVHASLERFSTGTCYYKLRATLEFAKELYVGTGTVNGRREAALGGRVTAMGSIGRYIDFTERLDLSNDPDQVYAVHSPNNKVIVWVGLENDATDPDRSLTTTNKQDNVFACEDLDENNECDYVQIRTCATDDLDHPNGGGAWYGGFCCGINSPQGSEYDVQPCDASENDPSIHDRLTRTFSGRTEEVIFQKPAICGINSENEPEWAYVEDIGGIHDLSVCPGTTFVSDGKDYYMCGDIPSGGVSVSALNPRAFPVQPLEIISEGNIHQYVCQNDDEVRECSGLDDPLSIPFNDVEPRGALIPLGSTAEMLSASSSGPVEAYCRDDGTFGTTLDTNPEACTRAIDAELTAANNPSPTEKYTGRACCGEDLDTASATESYNDPNNLPPPAPTPGTGRFQPTPQTSPITPGACLLGEWQQNSRLVEGHENTLIVSEGVLFSCGEVEPDLDIMDTLDKYTGERVIMELDVCDKVPVNADPSWLLPIASGQTPPTPTGDMTYTMCQPWGAFGGLGDDTEVTLKSIEWNINDITIEAGKPAPRAQGCCAHNQCWDGYGCVNEGQYYTVGNGVAYGCNP